MLLKVIPVHIIERHVFERMFALRPRLLMISFLSWRKFRSQTIPAQDDREKEAKSKRDLDSSTTHHRLTAYFNGWTRTKNIFIGI